MEVTDLVEVPGPLYTRHLIFLLDEVDRYLDFFRNFGMPLRGAVFPGLDAPRL